MTIERKRKNAQLTSQVMGTLNNAPELIKEIGSMIPVVGLAFKTAEMHKLSIQLLAEKAYNEGKLNYHSKLAWERYVKACEKESNAYDAFCHSFLDHIEERKKSNWIL